MKLFWKQFTAMVCLIVLSFAVFGSIFLQTSFQMDLERETERSLEEWKMFQYALLASLEGIPEEYSPTGNVVTEVSEIIESSIGSQETGIALYNEEKQLIYKNGMYYGGLIAEEGNDGQGIWRLTNTEEGHYLEALSGFECSYGNYFLAFGRNIQGVYDDRERMYSLYRITLIAVIGLSVLLSWFLSAHFTKPILKLSRATKNFARGNYESRVEVKGEDEVADLMRDFNRMAKRLEKSIWELEDAARRQDEFTGAFAHELKTPLTAIIGYGDMLRSMEMTEKERRSCADYIYRQGKRLERLSYKMMELVRVDKQDIDLKPVKTIDLTKEVRRFTERLLTENKIALEVKAEPGLIFGDMDLLCSLFGNLIDNARKAVCKYDVSDRGRKIRFIGRQEKGGYRYLVSDNGCGIPQEELGKITEAFYMVDKSRARKEGGAGLGMAVCRRIVELHHAKWSIESKEGEGTAINVFFPERVEEDEDQEEG